MTESQRHGSRGRIVTVFAAKGGCGKTILATNLAAILHAGGARRVCLVDLDLTFGDVASTLRLEPRRTIADAASRSGSLDFFVVGSLVTPVATGFDCILAPVAPGESDLVSADLVGELLAELPRWYDYVVVDTPAQLSPQVLVALDSAHHHVLLTTPERPALKSLRRTLDLLDLLSYDRESRSVVVNRYDSGVGLSAEEVESTVNSSIACRIPSSRDVPTSTNLGEPLVLAQPDHPVGTAIRLFAEAELMVDHPGFGARPA